MIGPDYSAWHYAPDALVRVTPAIQATLDVYVTIGVWSRTPTQETVTVAWSVAGGQETIVSAADVTAVDNAMASRLSALDSAPVTGPRPVAMAPYRLALARRARGNRYVEAVIRGVPEGAAVAYSVVVTPTSGSPVTLGPYSVLAVLPMFGSSDMIGGRSGDLVDPEPTWIGHVRRDDGVTHVRVDLDDIPAGGTLPVRVRIGGTWLSADYGGAPHNPGGRLPLLDWSADTVTFSAPDPGGVPVVIDVSGRRVAEADAGGPGRSRMLIAHFCIQAVNDLLEVPYSGGVYAPPRTYMQVTMADERGVYSSRPGVTRDQTHPGGYRDGLAMQRPFDIAYHLALNAGVLILTRHDCPDDLADMRIDVGRGLLHPAIAGYGSHRIPYYSADANVRDITADVQVIKAYLGAADGATSSTPTNGYTGNAPRQSPRCRPRLSVTWCSTPRPATTTTRRPSSPPWQARISAPACSGPTGPAGRTCCSSTQRSRTRRSAPISTPSSPRRGSPRSRCAAGSCGWRSIPICASTPC